MTAKEYLQKIKTMDIGIDMLIRELESWRKLSMRISGANLDEKISHSRNIDPPFVTCIDKVIDLERDINEATDSFVAFKEEAINKINRLQDDDHKRVLMMRYIGYDSWNEIAEQMKYSKSWVYKLHQEAMAEFEKLDSEV